MNAARQPVRTYLIEPQLVFVPYLERLLLSAGLAVVATSRALDHRDLAFWDPLAVFVDIDYLERNELYALRQIRQTVPRASIIAYSSKDHSTFAASCHIAGANALISKGLDEAQLVTGIRRTMDEGYFTDDKSLLTLLERK